MSRNLIKYLADNGQLSWMGKVRQEGRALGMEAYKRTIRQYSQEDGLLHVPQPDGSEWTVGWAEYVREVQRHYFYFR